MFKWEETRHTKPCKQMTAPAQLMFWISDRDCKTFLTAHINMPGKLTELIYYTVFPRWKGKINKVLQKVDS